MKDLKKDILSLLSKKTTTEPIITVIGDLNYDYIYLSPPLESGKEVIITDIKRSIAGASGYVACGFAKLGGKVNLLTRLGDDNDGHSLLKEIKKMGINTEGITLSPDKKTAFTLIFTQLSEKSPRQVATYPGALEEISIHNFDYKNHIKKSHLIYSCNYFIMPNLTKDIPSLFEYAKKQNIITAYDANSGDEWDKKEKLELLTGKIYPVTDIVFLNQNESFYLTGEKDPYRAINKVSNSSRVVVIKLGGKGSIVRYNKKIITIDPFFIENISDTVGAGDTYQATFLYFYLKGIPIEVCATLASANSASTLRFYGGTEGQCNISSLKDFIKDFNITIDDKNHIKIVKGVSS